MPVRRKLGKGRGRPKTDDPLEISYHLSASVVFNDDAVADERRKLGRFVLATNDLQLSPDTLLMYHKGQSAVERGFRFLKDKSFRVAEIFLKKNARIQALAMIMVLCLFIYSMPEFRLRRERVISKKSVISQTRKPTQRPSPKWVFFLFRRVREYSIIRNGNKTVKIANLSDDLENILALLGKHYENYYF
jgi:transposase